MHKDPPPGLFDARRPLSHVLTHGLVVGFILGLLVHFGWTLWRQSSTGTARPADGGDALVSGLAARSPASSATPPAVRYR